ncbi:hypothetical protein M1P56_16455 [Streptomyces sp. HU2014]|uniref:hypothetical protein n=1 Tax=Streptomyces sp. HU2014 TaxID=2939414 RepID=UPI00200DA4C1|nr:hypothetical protein [Streptomyces sp. HU2014]UQI45835.1 hypothetical protein M1P56_16455 [Streptomyces sp. HU2014]
MGMVRFVDETTAGDRNEARTLDIAEERLTLREVIRRRVFEEVADYQAREPAGFRGLIRPTEAELLLNGPKAPGGRRLDPQRCYERAVAAFARNGFLVLVGDRQVEELDEELDLPSGTEITFLKLVALVGG